MDRRKAIAKLSELKGKDLRALADKLGVTVWTPACPPGTQIPKNCTLNKGWAGHTTERYLGLPINSSQAPDFGDWELKQVSLKRLANGTLCVKETMAITMIRAEDVASKSFEQSHLLNKLRRFLLVARIASDRSESTSILHSVASFDLEDPKVFALLKADYLAVQQAIRKHGFGALTGKMGVLVQPRTKGAGHGSTTRAFYARTQFVSHLLGLTKHPLL